MIKHFLLLEWRSFTRAASLKTNIVLKIFMFLGALYFGLVFLGMGVGAYFLLKEQGLEPLETVNKYLIYYFVVDLVFRFMLQKMPSLAIRPLLPLNIKRNAIVHYVLGKSALSFFNFIHWFFFIPFTIVLIIEGYAPIQSILWLKAVLCLVYANNYFAVLIDKKDIVFYSIVGFFIALFGLQYYGYFDITTFTQPFFQGLYSTYYLFLIPVILLFVLYFYTFRFFKSELYLDESLALKQEVATTENLTFFDQWGKLGTFLKNDIRLIKRNKRARTAVIMSVLFLFYGLYFIMMLKNSPGAGETMMVFAGVFITGGFLFSFGQFVPSWDSSYYPLMMTQNIPYKEYLDSKWWLIAASTAIMTVLSTFYLYFGVDIYLGILACAVFNIGINSHLVLLGGAYIKTPIDLTSNKNAFGDKKAFNLKAMLISLPKVLLPVLLFLIGKWIYSNELGYLLIALAGISGLVFKNKVFALIEKIYKQEKHAALKAYKQ